MMRMFFVAFGLWLSLVGAFSVARADEPVDIKSIEDPRRLDAIGQAALADNDVDQARAAFTARLDRLEFTQYLPLRARLQQALVAESMQELEKAASLYREAINDDPLRVVLTLRIQSQHPEREALTAEVFDTIRKRAAAARDGATDAQIYTTTKGAPRYLTVMTTEEVVERARRGQTTQYCYVDELDFTKVANLPREIVLNRCVVGSVKGTGIQFGKLVMIRSFVLGNATFGRVFTGELHKSAALLPAKFEDLTFRETVFMGDALFAAIETGPRRAYFPWRCSRARPTSRVPNSRGSPTSGSPRSARVRTSASCGCCRRCTSAEPATGPTPSSARCIQRVRRISTRASSRARSTSIAASSPRA